MSLPKPVVNIFHLAEQLTDAKLVILDATIAKVGQSKLIPSHDDVAIPGARFLDLKGSFSDQDSQYPNTFPQASQFQTSARNLGINSDSKVVVYDRHGLYSAARAWYLFKVFGHSEVVVLDGGLPAWLDAELPAGKLELTTNVSGDFVAKLDKQCFVDKEQVLSFIGDETIAILDARSSGRFTGTSPEPRAEVRSGCIPRSQSLHYARLLKDGFLRSDNELKELFSNTVNKEHIFSCGSGVTACILALAYEKLGYKNYSVYDGSWVEWGSRPELPVELEINKNMLTKKKLSIKTLQGTLRVPGDKSITQRAYIFSALADGVSTVNYPLNSADADSCLNAVCALGTELVERTKDKVIIKGVGAKGFQAPSSGIIDCGNSGTAMRLLTGAIAGQNVSVALIGDESLNKRPMERVAKPMRAMGADIETADGKPPIKISGGGLHGAQYSSPVASAQVKSCVLLAGLQADGETTLIEPQRSRDHTERMLPEYGVELKTEAMDANYRVRIQGGQALTATEINVPADPSSAAFILVAACLLGNSEVKLVDVGMNAGRTGIILALRRMNADIELSNSRMFGQEPVSDLIVKHSKLQAIHVKSEQVVDMVDEIPVLMLAAAFAEGESHFEGLRELRVKESDRLALMIANLKAIGVDCDITTDDGAIVRGIDLSRVNTRPAWTVQHDHRLAMTAYIAKLATGLDIDIEDMEAASVSWPTFINDIESLCVS